MSLGRLITNILLIVIAVGVVVVAHTAVLTYHFNDDTTDVTMLKSKIENLEDGTGKITLVFELNNHFHPPEGSDGFIMWGITEEEEGGTWFDKISLRETEYGYIYKRW